MTTNGATILYAMKRVTAFHLTVGKDGSMKLDNKLKGS